MREVTETFVKTCPLLLTGLAVAFAFRCGVWNIGAEGQYLIGTLVTTWIGTSFTNLPPLLFIPLVLALGAVAGGFWGTVAGLLKAYRGVQEVISTIMLNFIALELVRYSIDGGPLQEAARAYQQSERIAANAVLPRLLLKEWVPHNPISLGNHLCAHTCRSAVLDLVSHGPRLPDTRGWTKSGRCTGGRHQRFPKHHHRYVDQRWVSRTRRHD